MVMGYWSVAILFWQLSVDHIVNVQCKRCGLGKKRLRHPSLLFDSLPYPSRTIRRRVRTYARSITWQPKEKRLTIIYGYEALSHARFARAGAPLLEFWLSFSSLSSASSSMLLWASWSSSFMSSALTQWLSSSWFSFKLKLGYCLIISCYSLANNPSQRRIGYMTFVFWGAPLFLHNEEVMGQ